MFAVVNTFTCLQLVFGTIVSTTDTLNLLIHGTNFQPWAVLVILKPEAGEGGVGINVRFVGCLPGHFSNENNSQLSDIV